MSWVGVAVGGIGAATSLIAGSQQAGAAKDANALQSQMYQQNRRDLAPWRETGSNALALLAQSVGVQPAGGAGGASAIDEAATLAKIKQGAEAWEAQIPGNGRGIVQMIDGGASLADVTSAMNSLRATTTNARNTAFLVPLIQQAQNPVNKPMAQTGTGTGATAGTGQYGGFRETPGYRFAFDEGRRAVDQSQAARGLGKSGATLRALTRYGTGVADQQYDNWLNRLASLSGVGQSATNTGVQLGQNYANASGQLTQDAAAARASGYVGATNSLSRGLEQLAMSGAFSGGGGYATYKNGAWTPGPQGFPG